HSPSQPSPCRSAQPTPTPHGPSTSPADPQTPARPAPPTPTTRPPQPPAAPPPEHSEHEKQPYGTAQSSTLPSPPPGYGKQGTTRPCDPPCSLPSLGPRILSLPSPSVTQGVTRDLLNTPGRNTR